MAGDLVVNSSSNWLEPGDDLVTDGTTDGDVSASAGTSVAQTAAGSDFPDTDWSFESAADPDSVNSLTGPDPLEQIRQGLTGIVAASSLSLAAAPGITSENFLANKDSTSPASSANATDRASASSFTATGPVTSLASVMAADLNANANKNSTPEFDGGSGPTGEFGLTLSVDAASDLDGGSDSTGEVWPDIVSRCCQQLRWWTWFDW